MHSTEDAAGTTPHATLKFGFIDALRGYAVLLVIASHVGSMFPELPYPVKKLTNFGWHGVQLFFLISCVTLLMSWRADERKGRSNAVTFWRRRFFRIAPVDYLAAAVYFIAHPPPPGLHLWQGGRAVTFVNRLHPLWPPTVLSQLPGGPGGL